MNSGEPNFNLCFLSRHVNELLRHRVCFSFNASVEHFEFWFHPDSSAQAAVLYGDWNQKDSDVSPHPVVLSVHHYLHTCSIKIWGRSFRPQRSDATCPICVRAAVGCKIECSSFYDSVIGPGCKHWCCKNKCVRLALHNKHKRLCLVTNRRLMLSWWWTEKHNTWLQNVSVWSR